MEEINDDNVKEQGVQSEDAEEQALKTSDLLLTRIFDWVADLFSKMVRGIFVFAFKTLPIKLWHLIFNQKLFRLVRAAARMIFWFVVWVAVVFASWLVIDIEKFKRFWIGVWMFCWNYLSQLIELVKAYANEIWIVIALIGSVYGLIYIPAKFAWRFWKKRRTQKKAKEVSNLAAEANSAG